MRRALFLKGQRLRDWTPYAVAGAGPADSAKANERQKFDSAIDKLGR
jgi:hypothetical protein